MRAHDPRRALAWPKVHNDPARGHGGTLGFHRRSGLAPGGRPHVVPSGGRAVIASRLLPALGRLSNALVASATLDELLRQILEIFLDAVNADVAVLRLVEDRSLRSRAALGLEEEVAAGHSLPIGDDLPTEPVARPPDGEFMKRKGV